MTTAIAQRADMHSVERMSWRIDPDRSSVEFEVATLWGLMTGGGRFGSYDGTLDLSRTPEIELNIDAVSLDTNHAVRDEHLRSAEFFDVENQSVRAVRVRQRDTERRAAEGVRPAPRRRAQHAARAGGLAAACRRRARGRRGPSADHCELGMPTWSPLGMLRTTSKLTVRGRLVSGSDLD
jgi:hypothetical protein